MNIILVATMVAKEGKANIVKEEVINLLQPTRAESGNITYRIHQDLQNENKFVAYEVWENAEALQQHSMSKHMISFTQKNKEQELLESFEFTTLTEL